MKFKPTMLLCFVLGLYGQPVRSHRRHDAASHVRSSQHSSHLNANTNGNGNGRGGARAAGFGNGINGNECEDLLAGSALAGRLWQNAPGTCALSPREVVKEFERGFAPIITSQADFQEYLGSEQTSDSDRFDHSFFYNVFSSAEEAEEANALAREFVADSILKNNIVNAAVDPLDGQFTGIIDFWSARECEPSLTYNTGRSLATRLWKSTEVSGQRIVDEFERGFRREITQAAGFQMYMGVVVDESTAFFMNVFDTEDEAADANAAAAAFIADGVLADKISLVRATTNYIDFDIFDPESELPDQNGIGGAAARSKSNRNKHHQNSRSNNEKRNHKDQNTNNNHNNDDQNDHSQQGRGHHARADAHN